MAKRSKSVVKRSGLGPGKSHLHHAVLGTVDSRGLGVQVGQELAAVEVTPLALFGVVVDGEFEFTLWAREASTSRVIHPHIDPNFLGGEINPTHLPRCDETQYLTVELGVVHGLNHAPGHSVHIRLPTENPEAPHFVRFFIHARSSQIMSVQNIS
jgi:hypothetical protein